MIIIRQRTFLTTFLYLKDQCIEVEREISKIYIEYIAKIILNVLPELWNIFVQSSRPRKQDQMI